MNSVWLIIFSHFIIGYVAVKKMVQLNLKTLGQTGHPNQYDGSVKAASESSSSAVLVIHLPLLVLLHLVQ